MNTNLGNFSHAAKEIKERELHKSLPEEKLFKFHSNFLEDKQGLLLPYRYEEIEKIQEKS